MQHKSLRDRENVLSYDVAEALVKLVGAELTSFPRALRIDDVVGKLVEMAHTIEDGSVTEITAMARRSMTDVFYNRLRNTAVFQTGYKNYEKALCFPVVPVCDFFFKIVYGDDGDLGEILANMTSLEMKQSLPKRVSRATTRLDTDGKAVEWAKDEDGTLIKFGDICGVIVFAPNSSAELLRMWLGRRASVAGGILQQTVSSIEHARPDSDSVDTLKEAIRPLPGAMSRALPRPKRR
jgi:hypothetical protein